jgi:flagellar M-ring protein FliF
MKPSREDVLRFIEMAVISLLTLVVLLLVVRPMLKRMMSAELPPNATLAVAGPGEAGALPAGGIEGQIASADRRAPEMIENSRREIGPEKLARVSEVAKSNPKETAALLRAWIAER